MSKKQKITKKKFSLSDFMGETFDFTSAGMKKSLSSGKKLKSSWSKKIRKMLNDTQYVTRRQPFINQDIQGGVFDLKKLSAGIYFPYRDVPQELKSFFNENRKALAIYYPGDEASDIGSYLEAPPFDLPVDFVQKLNGVPASPLVGKEYVVYLKQAFLKIIESITKINVVIAMIPLESVIISPDFDILKKTVGFTVYSKKLKTGEAEDLRVNYLLLFEQIDDEFFMDFELTSMNASTWCTRKPLTLKSTPELSTKSGACIDLCDGKEIPDDYFTQKWDKIELHGGNPEFNQFLLEPKKPGSKSRKLLNCIENRPNRFAGYFREIDGGDEPECEIIWEVGWEKDYMLDDEQHGRPSQLTNTVSTPIVETNQVINWINTLANAERDVVSKIDIGSTGPLKIYDVGPTGNSLFYALANSMIHSKILDFTKKQYVDISIPNKFIELNGTTKPVYKLFSEKLRELSNSILQQTFMGVHTRIIQNLTQGPAAGTNDDPVFNQLREQRDNLVEKVYGDMNTLDTENKIHKSVIEYLTRTTEPFFKFSTLGIEALCGFFDIACNLIHFTKERAHTVKEFTSVNAKSKFNYDGLLFETTPEITALDKKTIYLTLIDNHYMSTIPHATLSQASYNYLFQTGDLQINVFDPRSSQTIKLSISDFHGTDPRIDDSFLEESHDYIQWLFPNKLQSLYGPGNSQKSIYWKGAEFSMPRQLTLSDNDIHFIETSDIAKVNTIKSLMTMLKFYGFQLVVNGDSGIPVSLKVTTFEIFKTQIPHIKMKRLDDASLVKTRFENLRQNRHNYLRITRILKYLNNIKLHAISKLIITKLKSEIELGDLSNNPQIKTSLNEFWLKEL